VAGLGRGHGARHARGREVASGDAPPACRRTTKLTLLAVLEEQDSRGRHHPQRQDGDPHLPRQTGRGEARSVSSQAGRRAWRGPAPPAARPTAERDGCEQARAARPAAPCAPPQPTRPPAPAHLPGEGLEEVEHIVCQVGAARLRAGRDDDVSKGHVAGHVVDGGGALRLDLQGLEDAGVPLGRGRGGQVAGNEGSKRRAGAATRSLLPAWPPSQPLPQAGALRLRRRAAPCPALRNAGSRGLLWSTPW
jgi:hypothetical protein